MKILKEKDIDKKKWENLLSTNKFASPFQSVLFYDFFNSVPNLSAKVYAIEVEQELQALCVVTLQSEKGLKGFFSRRAIIYGGPLLQTNKEANNTLLKAINSDLKNKTIYTETRNFNDYSDFKNIFNNSGWHFEPYLNYHLNCTTEDIVQANLNTNRKRQIKKAFKNGVVIEEAKNVNEVQEFFTILNDLYQKKIRKPLLPFVFFKFFFESNIGKILLVKYQNKIIGGIVCPVLENKTIYELYICGLDQEYKDLSPSVMATYAAIEYGFKNNLTKFDFMGAGKPTEDYGVRDFKEKFGGQLVEHGRFIKINNLFLFNLGKMALSVLKKIK